MEMTDQQVWLQAYLSALSARDVVRTPEAAALMADEALRLFRVRWPTLPLPAA